MIRAALPYLRRGRGRILNASSIGGRIGVPHLSPYCAGKFALVGLSESLRRTREGRHRRHNGNPWPDAHRLARPCLAERAACARGQVVCSRRRDAPDVDERRSCRTSDGRGLPRGSSARHTRHSGADRRDPERRDARALRRDVVAGDACSAAAARRHATGRSLEAGDGCWPRMDVAVPAECRQPQEP